MLRLLQIELIKIKRYRTFWAILGIYALIFILVTGIFGMVQSPDPAHSYFSFPNVWLRLANAASYLNILPGILTIMLIANEYTFRTFRQNVIDGLSRAELIFSKFILIGAIGLFCVSFIFLWGFAKGVIDGHFDNLGQICEKTSVLFSLFVQMVGYMSLAALLTLIFRKAAFSILIYLVYVVAFERIVRWRIPDEIDRFFPMNVFTELIPDSGMMSFQGMMESASLSPTVIMLIACGYILTFFGVSLLLMKKSNL